MIIAAVLALIAWAVLSVLCAAAFSMRARAR